MYCEGAERSKYAYSRRMVQGRVGMEYRIQWRSMSRVDTRVITERAAPHEGTVMLL